MSSSKDDWTLCGACDQCRLVVGATSVKIAYVLGSICLARYLKAPRNCSGDLIPVDLAYWEEILL